MGIARVAVNAGHARICVFRGYLMEYPDVNAPMPETTNSKLADAMGEGDSAAGPGRRDPTVHAARHAIEILRCISQSQPEIGVSDIARRIGLHKSSVSRLVATLQAQRVVERNPHTDRVSLAPGLIAIAAPLINHMGISQASRQRMAQLAEESAETVNLSIWDGREAISIDQTVGPNAITHYAAPGQNNPAHCTASGKVLLAFASEADRSAVLRAPLTRYTERTITEPAVLQRELARVRETGLALNRAEFSEDAGAVAAIVRNVNGQATIALTITVPMYRFSKARERKLLELVGHAARDISGQIGAMTAAGIARRQP
ncbi:hypothetical protein CAL26_02905 [Bordetella genomosp. 9]|uniref:IclR family transcriptional regulator n=2 Tax=Bordetella genomosp. 9 TaxID=1416803 RepID=A0A261RMP2_9BORD|nr:hypothetical protein CAL26_02905 [Bordetella genomosp. 9]